MTANRQARIEQLRAASSRKHDEAVAKANRALMRLENRGRAINFTSVASEAGVSKDFLYKNEELRRAIQKRRDKPVATSPHTGASSSSDAVKLRVANAALKQLRAENEALRAENARLRGDLHALRRSSGGR